MATMRISRTLLAMAFPAALSLGVAVGGCDKQPASAPSASSASPTSNPAKSTQPKQPATTRVAAKPTAPKPVDTFMSITLNDDGGGTTQPMMVKFPPAKLRLKKSPDGSKAILYTDDPPEAANKDYRGNSYVFEMDFTDVDDVEKLGRARYRFHTEAVSGTESPDRVAETTNGVFLNGWDTHLQPEDVVVAFEGAPPMLMAKVVGTFRVVTSEREGPPRMAMVQAVLPASVEGK